MRAFRLLKPNEIECRIQQLGKYNGKDGVKLYARVLLYKTARTDAALLDEVIGPQNWQNAYRSIDGKLYCGIGIRTAHDWIWKWNTGTESNMEAQKGEASDAMKRAGFVLGIGTELYSAPDIVIYSPKAEIRETEKGKLVCYDRFYVRDIAYDANENISRLVIATGNRDVFVWPR